MLNTIQKKMILYILVFCILPVILLGFFYYDMLVSVTNDKLNSASNELLGQIDNNILYKINKLQSKVDLIMANSRIHEILRKTNFLSMDTETFNAQRELDSQFMEYFYNENDMESIIMFLDHGGTYTYGGYIPEANPVNFTMKYGKVDGEPGEITWLGVMQNPNVLSNNKEVIIAGLRLRDTNYIRDYKHLATIYIVFKINYFEITEDTSIMIFTPNGKKIFSSGENQVKDIWKISLKLGQQIFETKGGNIKLSINGQDCVLIYNTSPVNGWKYMRVVKYKEYFYEAERIKILTITIIIILCLGMIAVDFLWVRKITQPIRNFVEAMRKVGNKNFDVTLSTKSNDEFDVIAEGFNNMVLQIKNLFSQVVNEEKKSKEMEILALQYQINPHFLYNTLSAIRLTAIFNEQNDIAKMLLVLGRFLSKTISNANKMITIEEEIDNLMDFVSLYQIRYNNRIKMVFDVSNEVKEFKIYGMLIQPAIENAIMHGLNSMLHNGEYSELRISLKKKNDKLCISVRDNGIGMSEHQIRSLFKDNSNEHEHLHIGIRNINKRIQFLFGESYGIEVESKEGSFTEVKYQLPIIL